MIPKVNTLQALPQSSRTGADGQSGGNAYEKMGDSHFEKDQSREQPAPPESASEKPELKVLDGGKKTNKTPGLTTWFSALLSPLKKINPAGSQTANYQSDADRSKGMLIDEKAE